MKNEKSMVSVPRAALYIRVSTEEQAVHGLSIEAQREALDAWAETAGVQVARHYIDAGISARKDDGNRRRWCKPSRTSSGAGAHGYTPSALGESTAAPFIHRHLEN